MLVIRDCRNAEMMNWGRVQTALTYLFNNMVEY